VPEESRLKSGKVLGMTHYTGCTQLDTEALFGYKVRVLAQLTGKDTHAND